MPVLEAGLVLGDVHLTVHMVDSFLTALVVVVRGEYQEDSAGRLLLMPVMTLVRFVKLAKV